MSFILGYSGHQGNASHPCNVHQQCYVHQQSDDNQSGNLYPQNGFYHRRLNSPQTMPFMYDEEYQAYNQSNHGTRVQQGMMQQFDVPNQGFHPDQTFVQPFGVLNKDSVPEEAYAFDQRNVNQQAGIQYPYFSPQTPMSLESFNNDFGNFNQQGINYPGFSAQTPMPLTQFNNEGNIHPQPDTHLHQAFSLQEVMGLDPLNSQLASFYQQSGDYRAGGELPNRYQRPSAKPGIQPQRQRRRLPKDWSQQWDYSQNQRGKGSAAKGFGAAIQYRHHDQPEQEAIARGCRLSRSRPCKLLRARSNRPFRR